MRVKTQLYIDLKTLIKYKCIDKSNNKIESNRRNTSNADIKNSNLEGRIKNIIIDSNISNILYSSNIKYKSISRV